MICRGECLFGRCPFGECIKHKGHAASPQAVKEDIEILTGFHLPPLNLGSKKGLGIAVDIGTTTIVVLLYSVSDAVLLSTCSAINPQFSYGLDVISRIKFCEDETDGLGRLHNAVATQLNRMIEQACADASKPASEIGHAVITGNTTMLHLLCGISPVSMGRLPFEPLSRFGYDKAGAELGLSIDCACYLPPCPSAFVGADIAADMLYAGFDDNNENYLLMDIGTNGEVALSHNGSIYSSSTAAGPAFEGAHISCGMGAVGGAINKVYAMDGVLRYETIFDQSPRGLCGSGLLDAVATFVKAGAIDETGRIIEEDNPYITACEGQPALKITGDVFLTQKDVREFQMAKAAMAAGLLTIAHNSGSSAENIDTLFIAGGFGNFMDIDSAKAVGLVPGGINIKSIGNAACAGAAMLLLDDSLRNTVERISQSSIHVELGNNAYFMEKYMDSMLFEELEF